MSVDLSSQPDYQSRKNPVIHYKPKPSYLNSAGGRVTSIEQVRRVTKGNCKDLEHFVSN